MICHTIVCMVRKSKHDRNKLLPFNLGRSHALKDALIPWLNDKSMEPTSQKRVRGLLSLMREAGDLAQGNVGREALEITDQVGRILSHYKGIRSISITEQKIQSAWIPARPYPVAYTHFLEFVMVQSIMDAAEHKTLASVRECQCGRYFFARSTLNRFCSPSCRIEFWESSEERKEQKRVKARLYYMQHKTGIVKSRGKRKDLR